MFLSRSQDEQICRFKYKRNKNAGPQANSSQSWWLKRFILKLGSSILAYPLKIIISYFSLEDDVADKEKQTDAIFFRAGLWQWRLELGPPIFNPATHCKRHRTKKPTEFHSPSTTIHKTFQSKISFLKNSKFSAMLPKLNTFVKT